MFCFHSVFEFVVGHLGEDVIAPIEESRIISREDSPDVTIRSSGARLCVFEVLNFMFTIAVPSFVAVVHGYEYNFDCLSV